jgi:hypothetical protein
MWVAGAFGEEAGDDAFGERASALVVFFDDTDAEAGAERGARRRHLLTPGRWTGNVFSVV